MRSTNKNVHTKEDIKFFFNELRKATIIWRGRTEALRMARKKVFVRYSKKGKKIFKLHWKCSKCEKWYRDSADVEVDHITEIGGITEFDGDWNKVFLKMFPRPIKDFLQVLCKICHQKKTKAYMSASLRYERKKK